MIRARACCRVDLAGGTLDIWPLGVILPGASTVNAAIDVSVEVRLSPRSAGYRFRQGDWAVTESSLAEIRCYPEAALPAIIAEYLALPPVEMELRSGSPRGAGLGASSALAVALLAAGERFLGRQSSPVHLARAARDLEARLMGLPTGLQDHFPALLGGVLQIVYEPAEERVRPLVVDLDGLAVSMLVVFTGVSHFSAGNNWRILERFFAGEVEVRARFERIGALAAELVPLLEAGDWAHAGALMAAEWAERRALAPGITTAVLDQTLAEAEALGAYGGKACGAGGGGCLVFLVPPERRKVIGERMAARGLQVLPAAPSAEPLRIDTGEGA